MFKKHSWMEYGRRGEIIEITVRDGSGGKIDFFKCNNKEDYRKILGMIRKKYGYSYRPEIGKEESINDLEKEKEKEKGKDIEWLGGSKW